MTVPKLRRRVTRESQRVCRTSQSAPAEPVTQAPQSRWFDSHMLFCGLWTIIGSISCYDAYLLIKFQDELQYTELNPMGQLLLSLDGGPGLFVASKFLGTLAALGVLAVLRRMHVRLGQVAATAMTAFQLGLLYFLTVALPY